MYHLSVMCDFKKGGDSVTAIAMEKVPCGPRYWVAVNGHHDKIKTFLQDVLNALEEQGRNHAEDELFEQLLFNKFVLFQRPRIKEYWKFLQPLIKVELNRVRLSPCHTEATERKLLSSKLQHRC